MLLLSTPGHAFGFTQKDEDYYNEDRGDCLDYTVFPRNVNTTLIF